MPPNPPFSLLLIPDLTLCFADRESHSFLNHRNRRLWVHPHFFLSLSYLPRLSALFNPSPPPRMDGPGRIQQSLVILPLVKYGPRGHNSILGNLYSPPEEPKNSESTLQQEPQVALCTGHLRSTILRSKAAPPHLRHPYLTAGH